MKRNFLCSFILLLMIGSLILSACSGSRRNNLDVTVIGPTDPYLESPFSDHLKANYSYTFQVIDLESILSSTEEQLPDRFPSDQLIFAEASVDFTLIDDNEKYNGQAKGYLIPYALPSGKTFWNGTLEGIFTIEGKEIPILIGFSMLDEKLQLDVSFMSTSIGGGKLLPASVHFGDPVLTEELNAQMASIGYPLIP